MGLYVEFVGRRRFLRQQYIGTRRLRHCTAYGQNQTFGGSEMSFSRHQARIIQILSANDCPCYHKCAMLWLGCLFLLAWPLNASAQEQQQGLCAEIKMV